MFRSPCISPYTVHENHGQHMYHLQSFDKKIESLLVNGEDLNQYCQLISQVVPHTMYIVFHFFCCCLHFSSVCVVCYVNKYCALLCCGFQICVWIKFKESCDNATLG